MSKILLLGRTGPGVCFRLYSELEYEAMADFSTPEIQRVPLDSLILQMLALGLPQPKQFPFIQPPSNENVEKTLITLQEQVACLSSSN